MFRMEIILLLSSNSNVPIADNRLEITDCYQTTSSADIYPETGKVCTNLVLNDNANCDVFPEGVEVIFRWDNIHFTQSTYIYNFKYRSTIMICILCDTDNNCADMINTKSMDIEIRSVVDFTIISIGLILSHNADLQNCFIMESNTLTVSGERSVVSLLPNGDCNHMFQNALKTPVVKNITLIIVGERTTVDLNIM